MCLLLFQDNTNKSRFVTKSEIRVVGTLPRVLYHNHLDHQARSHSYQKTCPQHTNPNPTNPFISLCVSLLVYTVPPLFLLFLSVVFLSFLSSIFVLISLSLSVSLFPFLLPSTSILIYTLDLLSMSPSSKKREEEKRKKKGDAKREE